MSTSKTSSSDIEMEKQRDDRSTFGSYYAPDYDFESTFHWLCGERYYLQGSHQGFIDLFMYKDGKDENFIQRESGELIKIAKLALAKGELEIAEKTLVETMRSVMLDDSSNKRNSESFLYLAEILERRSEHKDLELAKKQQLLLQAAAMYNYVCNCLKTVVGSNEVESEIFKEVEKQSEIASRRLLVIQDNMISSVGGNPDRCRFDSELKRNELKNLRNEVKKSLESVDFLRNQESLSKIDVQRLLKMQTEEIRKLSVTFSASMKQFLVAIINECLELLGSTPCDYEVIVFGSLARNEMTPYSDFEWAILINSEEEECKVFFRNLTNLVHLQIINLGETILPSMNIEALVGGWFYDDITPKGISFDGFLPRACKTPLGNMLDFELIHTPEVMANFQNNDWHQRNWTLADTLLTFSPLQSNKHVLTDAYRKAVAKILSEPCDSEFCDHTASCSWPTRGTCRGLTTLNEDLSCYGDGMMGKYDLDDGKYYDVKKEIYRLVDRVFAALAKCYGVDDSGTFAILDELCTREIISPEARDNFASASAIAVKLRLTTCLNAGKQGEKLVTSSTEETGKLTSFFHMPKDEELFHFFFVAIPLYEELLQRFKTADNIPQSLSNRSFFDDSEATMGHVHCRLLNYSVALECYERALQRYPENLSIQIRRIRVAHYITKNVENAGETRKNLDTVLSMITESLNLPSGGDNNVKPAMEETMSFFNLLEVEDCRQLLEVLLFASQIYGCRKYFSLAEKIQAQCLTAQKDKRSSAQQLMIKFAFLNFHTESFVQQYKIDVVESELISFIDAEGVSTRSIVWLNKLGEFLFNQGKYNNAYRCFQRALSMERYLYGTNPNGNMMITLHFLGMVSMYLFMYMESKFYFKLLLQLFELFGGPITKLTVKNTYLQLALLSAAMGCPLEETVYYLKNGLKVTTNSKNDTELTLNCVIYCQLSTTWHLQQNLDQALRSVFDGETCLKDIVGAQARVAMTCLLAMTLDKITKTNEGIVILKKEIQELNLQSQMNQKAFCMMSLAKLFAGQCLAPDAEKYYKQALDILVNTKEDKHIFDILGCLIGISGVIVMDGRSTESKIFLDQAFNLAKKLPGSKKKVSILEEIGKLCESIYEVNRALQCYEEALRTCKESHIAKILPFAEFNLEVKLGEMAGRDGVNNPIHTEIEVPLEQRIQAQRTHYDRAADVLRKHVTTGQVDSTTVTLFLFLASKFTLINLGNKIELLLEALRISEIVYGTNTPHEMVTTILGQLSDTYWMAGDKPAATRYRELQLKMELKLHLSDPFHQHVSHNLTSLSLCFLETPGGDDAIQDAYESLMLAQQGKGLENTAYEATAARCFTSLSVLFYSLNDIEKAEALNEMASQLFCRIQESGKSEDLLSSKTCDIMRKILIDSQMTQTVSSTNKRELFVSILEVFSTDNGIAKVDEELLKKAMVLRQYGGFENSQSTNHKSLRQETSCKDHTTTSTDSKCDLENLNSHAPSSLPSSDSLNPGANMSTDSNVDDSLTQSLSQLRFPLKLQSLPDVLVNPESIKSTMEYFDGKAEEIESKLPVLVTLSDSVEYNRKIGNDQQVAKIDSSIQSQILSLYENCAFDGGEKLISDAVKAKESNNAFNAVKFLDLAMQLPSKWKRKSQILKLRGECFLSMGYYRTAAVSFTEAFNLYSSETVTVEKRDELCECLAVLIGLIKSEMLCKNVKAAWLFCRDGINLVSGHELTETIQAVELFYLGARCVSILSESEGCDDVKLSHASSLCKQALTCSQNIAEKTNAAGDLLEELGSSEHGKRFALKCEVQLLLAAVLQKLGKEEQTKPILDEMKEFLINIAVVFESSDESSIGGSDAEFLKISRRLYSWIGRVLVMCNDMILSITWLSKSLLAFFSPPLPDMLSVYEELLPLLQALSDIKASSGHETHSPFQQAIDMCKDVSAKHGRDLNTIYTVLKDLANVYTDLGRTKEAITVAEAGLTISDLMWGINASDRMNNRCRMLLYLAQSHHLNSTDTPFDRDKELHLAEEYYLIDHDSTGDFAIRKNLSYANFLLDQKRFAEADAVLMKIESLGEQVWQKFVFCSYSSRVFYGAGVQKSVEDHGELLATIGDIMYCTKVRVLVGMGRKREAVAACDTLTAKSALSFRNIIGKRPSCTPYLIEACHRELLTLVIDEERKLFQRCEFPLSENDLAKLYCCLNEYSLALKHCPNEVESPDMIEMKITCFHKVGNELVEMNRGNESYSYFTSFLAMLQRKEAFLDNPFPMECETLSKYCFTNQYYVFHSLGKMHCERGNLDAAIHCYERCLELDEDLRCGQDIIATLAVLYQTKALTVDMKNQDSFKECMNLALNLFQKLLQKNTELTAFVEWAFASLFSRLERYTEAIEHFENILRKKKDEGLVSFAKEHKPLLDFYLRRELDASIRINITIPTKVLAFYELILVHMKLNEVETAQTVALQFENYVERFRSTPSYPLALAVVGYAYQQIEDKEKAAEVFVSVLEIIPGHLPVSEALERCCL
ncbi:uncharacterized protein LOC114524443 [Dendronephthya gigantea]|uniref:uncharacterized protein LOC114524443 n=1 Tax=Dendronephthya gigantea TaxID=151771 RepID=UPI00106B09DA|nr:uncharacterized protein LOC114524443 [Dendronephthya gigantea]